MEASRDVMAMRQILADVVDGSREIVHRRRAVAQRYDKTLERKGHLGTDLGAFSAPGTFRGTDSMARGKHMPLR